MAENTVQIIIKAHSLLDDLKFIDEIMARVFETLKEDIVILTQKKTTKIAVDPFKDLGLRHL